jgi:hypothetical protein
MKVHFKIKIYIMRVQKSILYKKLINKFKRSPSKTQV